MSLKRITVSPGVLKELLGEIGSLASVYHKPAETLISRGRVGVDALRKSVEYAVLCSILLSPPRMTEARLPFSQHG